MKSVALTAEDQDSLKTFEDQWKTYKGAAQEVFSLLKEGKNQDALVSIGNGGNHANARRATADTFAALKTGILANAERIAQKVQLIKVKIPFRILSKHSQIFLRLLEKYPIICPVSLEQLRNRQHHSKR